MHHLFRLQGGGHGSDECEMRASPCHLPLSQWPSQSSTFAETATQTHDLDHTSSLGLFGWRKRETWEETFQWKKHFASELIWSKKQYVYYLIYIYIHVCVCVCVLCVCVCVCVCMCVCVYMHPLLCCAKSHITRIACMNGKQLRRFSIKLCRVLATRRIIPPTVSGRFSFLGNTPRT